MLRDADALDARVVGEDDFEWRGLLALSSTLIEDVSDGTAAESTSREGIGNGNLEFHCAVPLEECEESGGVGAERLATGSQGLEEGLRALAHGAQQVPAPELVRCTFLASESGDVRRVLHHLLLVPGALVARDLGRAVEDAYDILGGGDG